MAAKQMIARFRTVAVILIIALSLQPKPAHAQAIGRHLGEDGMTILHDAGSIITSPLRFTPEQWLLTGGVLGAVVLLHSVDNDVRAFAQRNQSVAADNVFSAGRAYGNVQYILPLSGGVYIFGLLDDNRDIRETGLMLIEALGFAGAAGTAGKIALGRSRPYVEQGPRDYHLFRGGFDDTSMPSGHSTVAFAVSSVLAGKFKNRYATVGLYTLAAVTAYSRVYHDQHWLSDTFAGAAIGTAMGLSVVCLHEQASGSSLSITPLPSGVMVSMNF